MNLRECTRQEIESLLDARILEYVPINAIEHPAIWVSQCFASLTLAVANGDARAISIACDLIEHDPMLPFGKLIKSNLARALKKKVDCLLENERYQVLAATKKLLNLRFAPREIEDYCKLVSKFPSSEVAEMLAIVNPKNQKVQRIVKQLSVRLHNSSHDAL